TIGIGGASGGKVFPNRYAGWIAIYRGRGRKHKILHSVVPHGVEQYKRTHQIVTVVFQGFKYAFSYRFQTGKMNDSLNLRVAAKQFLYLDGITQIHFFKSNRLAHNLLYPADRFLTGIDQIV